MSAKPETLSATVLRDQAAILALEAEWDRLLAASRADTVFLSWDWVRTWLDVAGPSVRPLVVAVRTPDGRLVGLGPHYVSDFRLGRVLPCRILRILGDYASGAECLDWIVDAELEEPVSLAIAQALARHGGWDALWMPFATGWTGAERRVLAASRAAGLQGRERGNEFGVVSLPSTFAQYLASLSRNARSMLSRRAKALEEEGGIGFDACTDAAALPALLQDLFRLNHLRWRSAGQDGTFVRKPMEARFYERFAPVALDRGWLRLYVARVKGEVKAVQYGYAYKGAFLQVQEGFDPDAPQGLGNVLRSRVVERCIAEGLSAYDFLGEYTEHKRRWGAEKREGHDFFVCGPGPRGRLLFQLGVWPTGRYLRPSRLPG